MTEEEMWRAVARNDGAYDGVFFYAVQSTGIYCRPSCKSKQPRRDNIRFFATGEQARAAGFRPCKRCRSDLPDYRPQQEMVRRAKAVLEDTFRQQGDHLKGLGLSGRRMAEVFRQTYGETPFAYRNRLRLEEAARLLARTDQPIVDIAYALGFGALSSFYRFFKARTGQSPAAYRKEHRR